MFLTADTFMQCYDSLQGRVGQLVESQNRLGSTMPD